MSKWRELFTELGLKAINNEYYAGKLNHFYSVINFDPKTRGVQWYIGAHPTELTTVEPRQLANQLSQESNIESALVMGTQFIIKFNLPRRIDEATYELRQLTGTVLSQLQANRYAAGCFVSGIDDGTVRLTQFNTTFGYYTQEVYDAQVQSFEEKRTEFVDKEHNLFRGLLGALPGIILGAILWGVLSYFGFYAWISVVFCVALAVHGYEKFGGKVTLLGAVLTGILMTIGLIGANFIEYAWRFYTIVSEPYGVSFWEVLQETPSIIQNEPKIREAFLLDLGVGIGIGVLSGMFYLRALYKEQKHEYFAQRFED